MSVAYAIARAETAAAALMVDVCVIKRLTGNPSDGNGNTTPTYATIYTGKCKIQQRQAFARPVNVGEAEVYIARLELHVPMTVVGVASDDIATVTTSRDADLVGRIFHVRELAHKTFESARRYQIIEVTS